MRFDVECSVTLSIEAYNQEEARNKGLAYITYPSSPPEGISQRSLWKIDVSDPEESNV